LEARRMMTTLHPDFTNPTHHAVAIDPTGQNRGVWSEYEDGAYHTYFAEVHSDDKTDVYFQAMTPGNKQVTVNQFGSYIQVAYAGKSYNFTTNANTEIRFLGSDGDDTFTNNTNLVSHANGGKGRDTLIGGSNSDYFGGPEDDTANNTLKGNDGNDSLAGGRGNDLIEGGLGDDNLCGRGGDDILKGGADDDTYSYPKLYNFNLNTHGADTLEDSEGRNKLDFKDFHKGIIVDLSKTGASVVTIPGMSIDIIFPDAIYDVVGSAYGDELRGNSNDNNFDGQGSNDIVEGRGGDDYLYGNTGNDRYVFEGSRLGFDTLRDWRNGVDPKPDNILDFQFFGGSVTVDLARTDRQVISKGNLELQWAYADIIAQVYGSMGSDKIFGNDLNNTLTGGDANDLLEGRGGNDTLKGEAGSDRYVFGNGKLGDDQVHEANSVGKEFDSLDFRPRTSGVEVAANTTQQQNINLDGTAGSRLVLSSTATIENLYGTDEGDILRGNSLDNDIWGMLGDDRISGFGGNDELFGMNGDDKLYGGYGNDLLSGGRHDDYMAGYFDDDTYEFYAGGRDEIVEDGGDDTLDFRTYNKGVKINLDFDTWQTAALDHQIKLPSDRIENVKGTPYADVIRGNPLDNSLSGESGNDTIYGRGGSDTLLGGKGNDGLYGGTQNDFLDGGASADRLLVTSADMLTNVETADAVISFAKGNQAWKQSEIELIDGGLAALHNRTGNTRLLERGRTNITFVRSSASATNAAASGDNRENGQIYIYNSAFGGSATRVAEAVVHEIAHNWDDEVYSAPMNAQLYTEFVRLSGWENTKQPSANKIRGSSGWYYTKGTEFARDYGKLNIYEDIATTWETYFYGSTEDIRRISQKIQAVDRFMAAFAG
jgi:Ca2+-binding RTX toxin-like protein